MKALVTGAAGFIGSHLSERLLADGWEVLAIDSFSDYYDRNIKEANLESLRHQSDFRLVEADLALADIPPLLSGSDVVFHLAAQAGVRSSWGTSFERYLKDNVLASQRLLEARKQASVTRLVCFVVLDLWRR